MPGPSTIRFSLVVLFAWPAFAAGQLTVTERLIRDEIVKLGGDFESARYPSLVGFYGKKFETAHYEMLAHLPTLHLLVVIDAPASGEALSQARAARFLQHVQLTNTRNFDGRGLSNFTTCRNLKTLSVESATFSSEGFEELLQLQSLTTLVLSDVELPDGAIADLARLKNLTRCIIDAKQAQSPDDIAALKAALPNCHISVAPIR